jgi:hypothetical protein
VVGLESGVVAGDELSALVGLGSRFIAAGALSTLGLGFVAGDGLSALVGLVWEAALRCSAS